jgi:Tat protein secretion system quality control protein TatD with DNase activity
MGIEKGTRNDPSFVPRGVAAIASIKEIDENDAKLQIRDNFRKLFKL